MSRSNKSTLAKRIVLWAQQLVHAESITVIKVFVRGVTLLLAEKRISIADAESIVFDPDVYIFCHQVLRETALAECIAYGMELSDVVDLLQPSERNTALEQSYRDIHSYLSYVRLEETLDRAIPFYALFQECSKVEIAYCLCVLLRGIRNECLQQLLPLPLIQCLMGGIPDALYRCSLDTTFEPIIALNQIIQKTTAYTQGLEQEIDKVFEEIATVNLSKRW